MKAIKHPLPTDQDFYPKLKIHNRWHLIVPELGTPHGSCAFHKPNSAYYESEGECLLQRPCADRSPVFNRYDCGDNGTIFIRPANFPEYRAELIAQKLAGEQLS